MAEIVLLRYDSFGSDDTLSVDDHCVIIRKHCKHYTEPSGLLGVIWKQNFERRHRSELKIPFENLAHIDTSVFVDDDGNFNLIPNSEGWRHGTPPYLFFAEKNMKRMISVDEISMSSNGFLFYSSDIPELPAVYEELNRRSGQSFKFPGL